MIEASEVMIGGNGDRSRLENELQANVRRYQEAAGPLLAELADAGFQVRVVGDLRHWKGSYRRAVPILLKWLPLVEYEPLKDDIIHTLSTGYAKRLAAPALISEFKRSASWNTKWAIGQALMYVADDSVFDDIAELVRDKQHGRGREMLTWALGKMKNARAVDILIELLDDEDVAGHAIRPLGKLRAMKARSKIERFLTHQRQWIRREARLALKRIDEAARE